MDNTFEEGMNKVIVNHYNHSGKWYRPRHGGTAKKALLLFICVLIVLENIMVLLALWKNKRFHTRMYFLIGNLALSDLLAAVAFMANILSSGTYTFYLTPLMWLVREGSMFVALSASTFSLLAIGIERHITMVGLNPPTSNRCRLVALLIACWCVSAMIGAMPSLGWNCLDNLPSCSTVLPLYAKGYIGFCITVFSALLVAVIILYIRIYRLVTSRSSSVSSQHSVRSLALLRTVVIVLGLFVICWVPLFIMLLLDVGCSPDHCPILYQVDWFITLAVLNSAMNPLVYTLTSREMRNAFFRLLCCCYKKTGPPAVCKPYLDKHFPTEDHSNTSCAGGGGVTEGGISSVSGRRCPTSENSYTVHADPPFTTMAPAPPGMPTSSR